LTNVPKNTAYEFVTVEGYINCLLSKLMAYGAAYKLVNAGNILGKLIALPAIRFEFSSLLFFVSIKFVSSVTLRFLVRTIARVSLVAVNIPKVILAFRVFLATQ